ncbi:N-acetyltransferase [Yersinia intermedia]|mgnify:FL=1|jgi:putative acetyltransferase|uniref:N-acetyltransferase n=1 Tax=Yersinia intermedia TaxID=631 RepID=A0A209A7K1_YERIN|nr:N-acetyltransferase [Yersinia intermedia]MCB5312781.1 N-acetyltransferase [Yersinia intermedia]MCB5323203.1 N-acetyltransferase [Yersinia intermedia]MCB5326616.1 N-acetyltransferase [Yersinia intermedia]OVZ88675.1 N-acetyltransferase [Yersinia intermedia]UNK23516.1 N-acetyltransferase [Yersinia intermedia]
MIRPYQPSDLDDLMQLWLTSTIAAHPFVAEQYWHESAPLVRNTYLPAARTWLYLSAETTGDANPIAGFISILEEQLVGALFVTQSLHGKGVGQALMDYVQQHYHALTLEVYQRNQRAYHFYRKQGFTVAGKAYNAETKNTILTLHWQRPFNSSLL